MHRNVNREQLAHQPGTKPINEQEIIAGTYLLATGKLLKAGAGSLVSSLRLALPDSALAIEPDFA
jgi:hypothetical protein